MPNVKVQDIGEFALIERVQAMVVQAKLLPEEMAFPLLLDIGDDAAVWRTNGATEVATTDTMVDGIHFRHDFTSWEDLGWKIVAVNLSDIAAMGASPLYILVTLGLKPDTEVEEVEAMYRGMLSACREHGGYIVGGDMVRSPVTFVTIAMTGVAGAKVLTRHTAQPGDVVAVTGPLGCAGGGLRSLLQGMVLEGERGRHLHQAHFHPQPRLQAGQALVRNGVRTAMDISDGLTDDLGKLCARSGVGAILYSERIPVDGFLREAFPDYFLQLALNGGEDYELLFTGREEVVTRAIAELEEPAAIVGRIVAEHAGRVQVVDERGAELHLDRHGWDHFK